MSTTYSSTNAPAATAFAKPAVGDLRGLADLIVDLHGRSKVPGLFHTASQEPAHLYWMNDPYKGELRLVEAATPPRHYQAMRLADIATLVEHFAGKEGRGEIFVACADGRVSVTLNETGDRRDRITMNLVKSAPYVLVQRLVADGGGGMLAHKAFIRLLQVALSGCVDQQDLTTIRKLRFSGTSGGESTVAVGRESLGNSVNREATANGGDVPEYITLTLPVYEDLVGIDQGQDAGEVFHQTIRCVFDLDLQTGTMRLVPLPDEVVRARRITDEWIYEQLQPLQKHQGVRVFCGAM